MRVTKEMKKLRISYDELIILLKQNTKKNHFVFQNIIIIFVEIIALDMIRLDF